MGVFRLKGFLAQKDLFQDPHKWRQEYDHPGIADDLNEADLNRIYSQIGLCDSVDFVRKSVTPGPK
jgi:hypothetical protein